MTCSGIYEINFPWGGTHNKKDQYYVKDWSRTNSCKVVNWKTNYNIYIADDYKRCVCDGWGTAENAAECAMEPVTGQDTQTGGEETGGEQTGGEQTGGEETGGEETGGEETGGEQTGGEETGGEQTGGEQTGGEQTGGEQTGGEQTGGEQTGGEETGGE